MQSVPGMQDTAIIIVIVCAVIAGVILRSIWASKAVPIFRLGANDELKHYKAPRQSFAWFGAFVVAITLIGLTSYLAPRDEAELRAERERDMQVALKRLKCPEKQAGDTDIIVLTFDTSADLHTSKPYSASNCSRIVDRGWMRQQPKPAIAARD